MLSFTEVGENTGLGRTTAGLIVWSRWWFSAPVGSLSRVCRRPIVAAVAGPGFDGARGPM